MKTVHEHFQVHPIRCSIDVHNKQHSVNIEKKERKRIVMLDGIYSA